MFISSYFRWFLGALALLCLANRSLGGKTINIKFHKTTSKQGGNLGQPVTSYYTNVNIGTPPKPFRFLLDTDANESWLPHYLKLGIIYSRLNYKNGYCKKDSKTSRKEEKEFTFEYQKCELTGKPYEDVFEFKDINESTGSNSTVSLRQRFLAVSSASNDKLSSFEIDGVLSLSPAVSSDSGTQSILLNLNEARLIDELRFGISLNNIEDSSEGGEITFGGIDQAKYIGNLRYHPMISIHRKWELDLQNVMLGGDVVSCYNLVCKATLSTSVNDFYGPREDVMKIMNLLGLINSPRDFNKSEENNLFEIDCLRVVNLPNLSFNIDGLSYIVPPSSYIKKKIDGLIFKSSTCYVTILPSDTISHWILGTNFISSYYTVFDLNKRQVGFATRRGS